MAQGMAPRRWRRWCWWVAAVLLANAWARQRHVLARAALALAARSARFLAGVGWADPAARPLTGASRVVERLGRGTAFRRDVLEAWERLWRVHAPGRAPGGVAFSELLMPGADEDSEVDTLDGLEENAELPKRPDIKLRVFNCETAEETEKPAPDYSKPVVLFLHGGHFVMDSAAAWHNHDLCCRMARRGLVVVAPDYRLAPEAPFPAAIQDAYRALELVVQGDFLPRAADPGRIVLAGAGAGGNLVAVLSSLVRDGLDATLSASTMPYPFTIEHQVLVYGQLFLEGPVKRAVPQAVAAPELHAHAARWCRQVYAPDMSDRRCAPWLAGLFDLPPTTVVSASADPLSEENELYASRLEQIGNRCRHHRFPAKHGFLNDMYSPHREPAIEAILADIEASLSTTISTINN